MTMPQFQIVTQAPLVAFIGLFLMLGGVVLLLFGLGIVQSGTGQDIMFKIKSGRQTSLIGFAGILLGAIGVLWSVSASEPAMPVLTNAPEPTPANAAEPTPTATIHADSSMYDDFNDPNFDRALNTSLWQPFVTSPSFIEQQNGVMVFSQEPGTGLGANLFAASDLVADQTHFIESEMFLSSEKPGVDGDAGVGFVTNLDEGQTLTFQCLITRNESQTAQTWCTAYGRNGDINYGSATTMTEYDTWHTARIEMDADINVTFYIDGQQVGFFRPDDVDQIKGRAFTPELLVSSPSQDGIKANFDDVRIGQLGE
jgi:hypothetical protein